MAVYFTDSAQDLRLGYFSHFCVSMLSRIITIVQILHSVFHLLNVVHVCCVARFVINLSV